MLTVTTCASALLALSGYLVADTMQRTHMHVLSRAALVALAIFFGLAANHQLRRELDQATVSESVIGTAHPPVRELRT